MNKKRIGLSAALLLGGAVAFAPAAQADAALDRAQDRAVEHYKRSKAGGTMPMAAKPGKGDAMKAGQKGDAMKSDMAKGEPMRAGAKGDMMKKQ